MPAPRTLKLVQEDFKIFSCATAARYYIPTLPKWFPVGTILGDSSKDSFTVPQITYIEPRSCLHIEICCGLAELKKIFLLLKQYMKKSLLNYIYLGQ